MMRVGGVVMRVGGVVMRVGRGCDEGREGL